MRFRKLIADERQFWADLDAEKVRLDQALYNFRKREREQRPGMFCSYAQMAKWVGIWLLAVAALAALIIGWMAL